MAVYTEALACLFWFFYSSFFEWFIHRHFMHVKRRPLQEAFEGHTFLHHQIYHGINFVAREGGRPPHVMLRPVTFPAIFLLHLPIFLLVQRLTGLPTVRGAAAGALLYYAGFEYLHYLIHVPRGHFVERFRWFRSLREHHRLHHKYMLRNLNVLLPLADICFGTLVTAEGWRSKAVKRRQRVRSKSSDASRY